MAPKKKEQVTKMSLGDFMNDSSFGGSGNWADDVEDDIMTGTQALPMPERRNYGGSSYGNDRGYNNNNYGNDRGDRYERNYAPRHQGPQEIPDKPPYTAHLGNLSYDATIETVTEFFQPSEIVSVRIIEDRETQRPKGFAYAEFKTPEGLQAALDLDGTPFQNRPIRIKIADPPKDRPEGFSSGRDLDWTRKGPLADLPNNNRNNREFSDRRPPREPVEDRGIRELGTWERKGPLSPPPQEERPGSSFEERPQRHNGGDRENFRRGPREGGAAWGEGRQHNQDDSRPPRPERVPTAAERDNQWRSNMRPDNAPAEVPPSPATPTGPGGRPRLNLQKRTVTESAETAAAAASSKANPFGAARPIDTSAREREVEEKRQQVLKEKKEAEEKAKEEAARAKEAEEKAAAEKAEAEAEARAAAEKAAAEKAAQKAAEKAAEKPAESAEAPAGEQKLPYRNRDQQHREPREPREPREQKPSRAAESGNWRSAGPRGAPGPRRGDNRGPRGGRNDGGRGSRYNNGYRDHHNRADNHRDIREQNSVPSTPVTASAPEGESAAPAAAASPAPAAAAATPDDDGWTTVAQPRSRRNGRTMAS